MKNDVMSTTSDYFGTCITLIKKKTRKTLENTERTIKNGHYRETFSLTILSDIHQCIVYNRLLRLYGLFEV